MVMHPWRPWKETESDTKDEKLKKMIRETTASTPGIFELLGQLGTTGEILTILRSLRIVQSMMPANKPLCHNCIGGKALPLDFQFTWHFWKLYFSTPKIICNLLPVTLNDLKSFKKDRSDGMQPQWKSEKAWEFKIFYFQLSESSTTTIISISYCREPTVTCSQYFVLFTKPSAILVDWSTEILGGQFPQNDSLTKHEV